MNHNGFPIPALETLDFDDLILQAVKRESRTKDEILTFISHRMSLQAGLELLGVPLFAGSTFKIEKERSGPLLQAFEDYLIDHGYDPPEMMWEPVGLTIFDPYLNEDTHIAAANSAKRRQGT